MSSDRVVIENVLGRVQKLFGVMHRKYVWSKEKLDAIADICFSLANFHICIHPLREEDREYFNRTLSSLRVRSEEAQNAGHNCMLHYCRRCKQMEMVLQEDYEVENTFGNEGNCIAICIKYFIYCHTNHLSFSI